MGGALTPVGDPPLYLGFLKGVPFWWVLERCWGVWATALGILLLRVVHDHLAVDAGDDVLADDLDGHGEPLAVLRGGFQVVLDAIEAGGLFGVAMGIVHLHLVALGRPARALEFRVKIDAGVRLGERLDVQRELEVLELRAVDWAGVEQMRPFAVHSAPR